MRYRLMATYQGVPYEAGIGPAGTDVVLFAACPPPEELGFEPAPGHWRKRVARAAVDALWESRPVGIFRGEPCIVLDDLGDRLHIAYLGTDPGRAALLGYWQVDRGVFELLAPSDEVTGLAEERIERPLQLSGLPPAPGTAPAYPYGTDPWPSPSADAPGGAGLPAAGPVPSVADAALSRQEPPPLDAGQPSPGRGPGPGPQPAAPPGQGEPVPAAGGTRLPADGRREGRSRSARRQRVTTRAVFSELADLAAIPRHAYALEEEVDGAMCLLPTAAGYEVFLAAGRARHEVRSFPDEEAAYFYLFGVLAAESIRSGRLAAR